MEFASRRQREGESVREFVGALRKLAKNCRFPIRADDAIITQLTVHATCETVREKLLQRREEDSFDSTIAQAARAETNAKEASRFIPTSAGINKMSTQRRGGGGGRGTSARQHSGWPPRNSGSQGSSTNTEVCGRCAGQHDTQSPKCPARKEQCLRCKRTGHFARMCNKKNEQGVFMVDTLPEPIVTPPGRKPGTAR